MLLVVVFQAACLVKRFIGNQPVIGLRDEHVLSFPILLAIAARPELLGE